MKKKILCQEIQTNITISNKTNKINNIINKINKINKISNSNNKDSKIKTDKTIFRNKSLRKRNIHQENKSNRRVLLNSRINFKQFNVINVRHMAIMQILVIKPIKKTINNNKIKQCNKIKQQHRINIRIMQIRRKMKNKRRINNHVLNVVN